MLRSISKGAEAGHPAAVERAESAQAQGIIGRQRDEEEWRAGPQAEPTPFFCSARARPETVPELERSAPMARLLRSDPAQNG